MMEFVKIYCNYYYISLCKKKIIGKFFKNYIDQNYFCGNFSNINCIYLKIVFIVRIKQIVIDDNSIFVFFLGDYVLWEMGVYKNGGILF